MSSKRFSAGTGLKGETFPCRWAAGAALIALGLFMLLGELIRGQQASLLIPVAMGLTFLLWGIAVRRPGLLVPGGILTGLGLGIFLTAGAFHDLRPEPAVGVIMLSFAFGLGIITPLSALFTCKTLWWTLLPAGMLALLGVMGLTGGPMQETADLIGKAWPVLLIPIGLYLLIRNRQPQA